MQKQNTQARFNFRERETCITLIFYVTVTTYIIFEHLQIVVTFWAMFLFILRISSSPLWSTQY